MDRQPKTTAFLFALAAPALVLAAVPETRSRLRGPPRLDRPSPELPMSPWTPSGARRSASASTTSSPGNPGRRPCPIVRTVTPAVVFVETEAYQRVRTILGTRKRVATGAGSGVVIHPSGLIVTNYHVVEGAQNIRVSFEGEPESYVAELMSFVREEDLALLKIRPDEDARPRTPSNGRPAGSARPTPPASSPPYDWEPAPT